MSPIGYPCYKAKDSQEKLDLPDKMASGQQKSLGLGDIEDGPITTIKKIGVSNNEKFVKYKVHYEAKIEEWGRQGGREFHNYIAMDEFHMLNHKEKPWVLFDTNIDNSRKTMREFQDSSSSSKLPIEPWEFDLKRLIKEEFENITGGHFSNVQLQDVESAALWGPDVSDSEDWKKFSNLGEIKHIQLQAEFKNSTVSFGLSMRGSVVVNTSLPESQRLDLVEEILEKIKTS